MAVSFPRYLALAITVGAGACKSEPAGLRTLPVVNITVTPAALTLPVGASRTLAVAVRDLEGRPLEGREIPCGNLALQLRLHAG